MRRIAALVAALVLVVAVTLLALPSVVRWVAINRLRALTAHEASIENVRLNLFTGRFELTGFRLADRDGRPPLIEVERIEADFRLRYLLLGRLVARELNVEAPTIRIVRTGPRELNISDLLAHPSGGGGLPIIVRLERLQLAPGTVRFEDRTVSPARVIVAEGIALALATITSEAGRADGTASATLTLAGAPATLQADGIGLSPGRARAVLTLTGLDLAPFLADATVDADHPSRGRLTTRLDLAYDPDTGARASGEATVADVELRRAGQTDPVVAAPALTVAWRDIAYRDGRLTVDRLEAAGEPTLLDGTRAPPPRFDLKALRLLVEHAAYPTGPPAAVTLTATLPRDGALDVRGTVAPERQAADLAVTVTGVDVALAGPYLPADAEVTPSAGRVDVALTVAATAEPSLRANGEITCHRCVLLRRGQSVPFVTHPRLRARIGDLTWVPGAVALRRLDLEDTPTVVDASVSPAVRLDFQRLALSAEDMTWPSTRPVRVRAEGATTDGGRSTLAGTFDPGTLAADIRVTFQDLDVARAAPYLPATASVRPAGGRLGVTARLRYDHAAGVRLGLDGAVTALALARPGESEPILADRRFAFTVPDLRLKDGALSVPQLTLTGVPSVATGAGAADRVELRALRLDARDLAWPSRQPVALELRADLPGTGTLQVAGSAALDARVFDLRAELRDVAVGAYQAWLPVGAPLAGTVDARLTVAARLADRLEMSVTGDAEARGLALGPPDEPAVMIDQLRADGIDIRWPTAVRIARVRAGKPRVLVERDADGRFPLRAMLTRGAPAPEPGRAPEPSGEAPVESASLPTAQPRLVFSVGQLVADDGDLRFVDRSARPLYAEELSRLALTLDGLTTAPDGRADVTLQGILGTTGALDLKGQVAPGATPFFLEIEGELREFPLPRTNSIFRRFFDWLVRRGSLTTRVHYRVVGDHLEATNRVRVERLDVERDPTPVKADRKIGLPLGLIVSMVTDASGDIEFNLPVQGNLGSPAFSLGDAIVAALKNALLNLVTGPFHAIGRLFGGGERPEEFRVDPVSFEPGSATVTPEASAHLQRVADFLRGAPKVRLGLRAVVSADDLATLQTTEVTARIQQIGREGALASFDAAAAALFAREVPGEPAPKTTDEIVERLREREPPPEAATRALAARRLEVAQRVLIEQGGVDGDRLRADPAAPEPGGSGSGRVEFELIP